MREDWARSRPILDFDITVAEALIAPVFPGARIVEMRPVEGGLTNTNFWLQLADRTGALLLRFYQRTGDLAQKERALCQKLAGRVPVPAFLHYAPENPATGHAFALIDWIDAKPLQSFLPGLTADAQRDVGAALGRTLAATHGFTYPHFAYLDGSLQLGDPMDLSGQGLVDYLNYCLVEGRGGGRLGPELTQAVIGFAKREGHRIEAWQQQPCLVHGDFNPTNVLMAPDGGGRLDVAAVIDWEYAFAGTPAFDFANLLRPPLNRAAAFAAGLESGYRAAGGRLPQDWRRIAAITDLYSFADVLQHAETQGTIVADMKTLIARTIF